MFCPHLGLSISESVWNDAAIMDRNNNTPDYIEVGICDWARKSSSYKKLLEHIAHSNTSTEEIVKQFINIFQIKMVMGKTDLCLFHHVPPQLKLISVWFLKRVKLKLQNTIGITSYLLHKNSGTCWKKL